MFFILGAALGMWLVPLSTVLDAHGLRAIKPYAFAANGAAAFVSPLIFGALHRFEFQQHDALHDAVTFLDDRGVGILQLDDCGTNVETVLRDVLCDAFTTDDALRKRSR